MDKSISFELLTVTRTQCDFGQFEESYEARTVYGQVTSVSAEEFFAGGQNGYKPEFRITMFGPDYHGEQRCKIGDDEFSIYRVYHGRTDSVELYLERRAGDGPEEEDENDNGSGS